MRPRRRLQALAHLAVTVGANVQPGQIVAISAEVGEEALVRAIADEAYARDAKFVDVAYHDPYVKRARLAHATDREALRFVPPWIGERVNRLGEERAALIAVHGPAAPHAMDGIDPTLLGIDLLPSVKESKAVTNGRLANWSVIPCPTPGWAALVYPELSESAALERLWEAIEFVCRLEEPDPTEAWRSRLTDLRAVAERLTALELDAVHLEGPGTDLTVGLLAATHWISAYFETIDGIIHVPNIPTEEVWTSPDPQRVDGHVTATKPLFVSGQLITGLRVRFEAGRAVAIEGDAGVETLRRIAARDEGASRLGELALVDRSSRIGQLGTVFSATLLDENAASHIALGSAYSHAADDEQTADRLNHSEIHVDFMIGSSDVAVTGITRSGERIPLLRSGDWQI